MKKTQKHFINSNTTNDKSQVTVLIIGCGFSGLGLAIQLKQKGVHDFLIIEKSDEVGGVWRDNTYPGCACDVESHLYSFSFAPNANWSRLFSGQAEIKQYLQDCAQKYDILPHVSFKRAMLSARWDLQHNRWQVETSQGTIDAQILVSATGVFNDPLIPPIPGIEKFKGQQFHSAQWDHQCDLGQKNIVVIGTGASAIQFIPQIQPLAKQLTVFQRTPAWILPKPDRKVSQETQKFYHKLPLAQKLRRYQFYCYRELYGITFRQPQLIGFGEAIAKKHLARAIKDPELQKKLTPNYKIGCKRVLLSNNFYPTLAKPNVKLMTNAITQFSEHHVHTQEGHQIPADIIIWGTGFKVTEFLIAQKITGPSGTTLQSAWNGSPQSFLGTSVAGFPNLFFLLGPNTGLGHSSVIMMIEAQIKLVVKTVLHIKHRQLKTIEPKPEKQAAYNLKIAEKSQKTVWLSGECQSWYLDQNGRNSTLWPGSIGAFCRRLSKFNPRDYISTS